jgi:hypothetical protein
MPGSRQIWDCSLSLFRIRRRKIAERQIPRHRVPGSMQLFFGRGGGIFFDLPIPGSAIHCDFAALRLSEICSFRKVSVDRPVSDQRGCPHAIGRHSSLIAGQHKTCILTC